MYRLIATDLDGTLLTDDKKITDYSKMILAEAMEKGLLLCLCSGRAWPGSKCYAGEISSNGPVVAANGAMIIEPDSGRILYDMPFEAKDAMDIYRMGNDRQTTQIVWCKNILYSNRIDERSLDYGKRYGHCTPTLIDESNIRFDDLAARGISKILWYNTTENIREWSKTVTGGLFHNVVNCTSEQFFLEFFHKNVSKGNALKVLGGIYGIAASEMIAFGDGCNDISMLEYAGLGVAMGNSKDEVKQHANAVCPSNEEDGVAVFIKEILVR